MTWEESNTTYSSYNWMLITILFVRFSLTNLNLTNLVLKLIIQKNFLFQTMLVGQLMNGAYEEQEPTTNTWARLTSVVSICYQECHIHGVTKRVHHCSHGLLFSLIGSVTGCNANFTSLLSNKLNPQRSTISGYLSAEGRLSIWVK